MIAGAVSAAPLVSRPRTQGAAPSAERHLVVEHLTAAARRPLYRNPENTVRGRPGQPGRARAARCEKRAATVAHGRLKPVAMLPCSGRTIQSLMRIANPTKSRRILNSDNWRSLLSGSGVVGASRHQGGDELAEKGFASAPRMVHELEEAEVQRHLLLRDAAVRPQPGAQQRPDPFHGVDVDLAEPVAVLVTGVLTPGVAHGLVPVPPLFQPGVDVVCSARSRLVKAA
jgi:hypothetical protein